MSKQAIFFAGRVSPISRGMTRAKHAAIRRELRLIALAVRCISNPNFPGYNASTLDHELAIATHGYSDLKARIALPIDREALAANRRWDDLRRRLQLAARQKEHRDHLARELAALDRANIASPLTKALAQVAITWGGMTCDDALRAYAPVTVTA